MNDILRFGIDLGTTNSRAAIFGNNIPSIVVNYAGKSTLASIAAFTNDGISIGFETEDYSHSLTKVSVMDVKKLIGKSFASIEKDLSNFDFGVESDQGNPVIVIKEKYGEKHISPEQVLAEIFKKYAKLACNQADLPQNIDKQVVITVPAYFNDKQRKATKQAAELAGLNVLQIVDESIAAGLAYCYNYVDKGVDRNVLVYDFGGSSCNVSIVEIKGKIKVKASDGVNNLGGEDIDNNLVDYYVNKLKKRGCDISNNKKRLYK